VVDVNEDLVAQRQNRARPWSANVDSLWVSKVPSHQWPILKLLETQDPLQCDGIRVACPDHDATAVRLNVVVVVMVDDFQQGALGEKLADGGCLSGMVQNALYAQTNLERQLGGLCPNESRPWEELDSHLTNDVSIVVVEDSVADAWRREKHQKPRWWKEIHSNVAVRNP
jgi:hypothetical protein